MFSPSRLRLEASQCPEVVVAQIDPKKLRKKQTVIASVSESITRPHEASAGIDIATLGNACKGIYLPLLSAINCSASIG